MELDRVVIQWSGAQVVGGGVTVLHFAGDSGVPGVGAIGNALTAFRDHIPTGVSFYIPSGGDKIEDTTGELVGVWDSGGDSGGNGTGAATAAAGAGACISWKTGGIVNGKKLRGRTFIVPLPTADYDNQGSLTPACVAALNTLADAIQASGPLAIWHRPTKSAPASGNSYGVIAHSVRDKVAMLRSRRD